VSAHDEHGNPVLEVDPLSSAGQLVALLEWARRRNFKLGPMVKIGDVMVQVTDLRQDEGRGRVPDEQLDPDVARVMGLGDQ
jgi:hypothetical protein